MRKSIPILIFNYTDSSLTTKTVWSCRHFSLISLLSGQISAKGIKINKKSSANTMPTH